MSIKNKIKKKPVKSKLRIKRGELIQTLADTTNFEEKELKKMSTKELMDLYESMETDKHLEQIGREEEMYDKLNMKNGGATNTTFDPNNPDIRYGRGGGIPDRYKNMGFSKVGQKKKSTRPQKKWMVLAKKGDKYKVVHGGQKGMKDFSQHRNKDRKKRFWNRMGGLDSGKARDPFSPLYWHKRFGTWEDGGVLEDGTLKVVWIDAQEPETFESKMFDSIDDALRYADGKTYLIMELQEHDDDYYKWNLLPYGEYKRYKRIVNWSNIFEEGGHFSKNNDKVGHDIIYDMGGIADSEWFRGSVVVDDKGNPLIVYHGTDKKKPFIGEVRGDIGIHFGTRKASADRLENLGIDDGDISAYYLSIKNPIRIRDVGAWADFKDVADELLKIGIIDKREYDSAQKIAKAEGFRGKEHRGTIDIIKKKGYDGFVYKNTSEDIGSDSYIVLDTSQIREADANKIYAEGGKTNYPIERMIERYNLSGSGGRIKFKDDQRIYINKNLHPDRKHIFVYHQDKDGSTITKRKRIKDIISINEKPVNINNFTMQDGGKIKDILKVLNENPFYSEKSLSFINLSPLVEIIMNQHLIHDKSNPIITRFNEAVYFEPSPKHIQREGDSVAKIEYALHFITGDIYEGESKKRTFDKSKFDAIQLLIPVLKSPDVQRLYQKGDKSKNRQDAIVYAKEISIGDVRCITLIAEMSKNGVIRAITFLPKDKCGFIQKQKASNVWLDAPVTFSPPNETPPFSGGQIKAAGGSISHNSNIKDNNIFNTKNTNTPISIYNTNSQLVTRILVGDNYITEDGIETTLSSLYNKMEDGGFVKTPQPLTDHYFITGPKPTRYRGKIWFGDLNMITVERVLGPDRFEAFKKRYYLDLMKSEALKFVELKLKSKRILN